MSAKREERAQNVRRERKMRGESAKCKEKAQSVIEGEGLGMHAMMILFLP